MDVAENDISPLDSLKLIADVINKTRENVRVQSFCYLLWGWLISSASIIFYLLHQYTDSRLFFLPFPIAVITGIAATFLYKLRKSDLTETYLNKFLNQMWITLGLSFIVVVIINTLQHHSPFTYTLIIAGIGTLTSGRLMRFKPMIFGGILFIAMAIVSVFVDDNNKPLLHAITVIGGYVVPGYLLKFSKRNSNS